MIRLILSTILLFMLSACAETGTSLTLEANYEFAGTQVSILRLTATVQAARAETTLDFMGTRAARAATQSDFFEETLVATGISPDVIATQRQVALGSSPTPLPTNTLPPNAQSIIGDPAQQGQDMSPTPPPVTLNAPITVATPTLFVPPTPDLGGLTIGNVTTAQSAGDDGCGAQITSIFGADVQEIYVIIPSFNITANDYTFAARWQRDGQPVGPVYDFAPDADIDQLCIWFFVDETDFAFEPGSYSVFVDVNGAQVAGPIPFVIQ